MTKLILLKGLLLFLGILVALILLIVIAFNVSPKPGALIIRNMFNSSDSKDYQKFEENVAIMKDEQYGSHFKDNSFDIYYPQKSNGPLPVLIWVHGGGFVAGDKSGSREFASKLVSDAHIAVLLMNYETAPESAYPNQLIQVGELVDNLKTKDYHMLDLSNIMLGGDSAGSQIALQYVLTQTNSKYGENVGVPKRLDKEVLRGAISYCGPVNLKQMADLHSSSLFMKFFVNTVAWSEIGTRNWRNSPKLEETSLVSHLTSDFPATYITDGNAFSFQNQGIAFEKRLKELKVPVQGLFYKNSKKEVTHEYQFDYSLKEAQECYKQTLEFINEYKKR